MYVTESRSGDTWRPKNSSSSAVLTTATTSSGGTTRPRPSRKRAAPTPPASAASTPRRLRGDDALDSAATALDDVRPARRQLLGGPADSLRDRRDALASGFCEIVRPRPAVAHDMRDARSVLGAGAPET